MMNCIAIDDEQYSLKLVEEYISRIPFLNLVQSFVNPLDAIPVLKAEDIHLIFLDIMMPQITGINFLTGMQVKPMAIFITAYEKFAVESYNIDAIDYLMKPVSFERFLNAASKAVEKYTAKTLPKSPVNELSIVDSIFVYTKYALTQIKYSDILFIEAMKDYIKIFTSLKKVPIITKMSISTIEEKLPKKIFIRVHRSFIVSKPKISSIREKIIYLGDDVVPVGSGYKHNLFGLLM